MKRAIVVMITVGVALPLGGSAVSHLFFPGLIWYHEPFHAFVEAVGAFTAFTLAILLYLQVGRSTGVWTKYSNG